MQNQGRGKGSCNNDTRQQQNDSNNASQQQQPELEQKLMTMKGEVDVGQNRKRKVASVIFREEMRGADGVAQPYNDGWRNGDDREKMVLDKKR